MGRLRKTSLLQMVIQNANISESKLSESNKILGKKNRVLSTTKSMIKMETRVCTKCTYKISKTYSCLHPSHRNIPPKYILEISASDRKSQSMVCGSDFRVFGAGRCWYYTDAYLTISKLQSFRNNIIYLQYRVCKTPFN